MKCETKKRKKKNKVAKVETDARATTTTIMNIFRILNESLSFSLSLTKLFINNIIKNGVELPYSFLLSLAHWKCYRGFHSYFVFHFVLFSIFIFFPWIFHSYVVHRPCRFSFIFRWPSQFFLCPLSSFFFSFPFLAIFVCGCYSIL